MPTPTVTRLRYAKGKDPDMLCAYLGQLPFRVQIYSIAWDGSAWIVWFVPPDDMALDVTANVNLDVIS